MLEFLKTKEKQDCYNLMYCNLALGWYFVGVSRLEFVPGQRSSDLGCMHLRGYIDCSCYVVRAMTKAER